MPDVFVSYARPTEPQARLVCDALRADGFEVWRDAELLPHRPFSEVLEDRLAASKAIMVLWSSDALRSDWVRAEADFARKAGNLVQVSVDGTLPPLPFDQLHCVSLAGWSGDPLEPGWRKVWASVSELSGRAPTQNGPAAVEARGKPSLAVMPFANLSAEPDQDYFAEGMLEEIITSLSRIRSIFVIGSGSSLSLKGQSLAPAKAAERLGVRYILEGSVRRAGPRVRISVHLSDAVEGSQIWNERFDGVLDDIFALQDQVALSVAGVIEPTLLAAEAQRAARRPLDCAGCYDLYLRAAALRATLRRDEVMTALELLDRAQEQDADFAPALAQAASCHSLVVLNNWSADPDSHRRKGLALAERAIKAGAGDAAVLAQTANALMELDRNIERAAALIDRATTLNPGSAYAWFVGGVINLIRGSAEAAILDFQSAARLDPISPLGEMARTHVAVAYALIGELDDAARVFRQTTYRTPRVRMVLIALHGWLGEMDDAREEQALYHVGTSVPLEVMVRGTRDAKQRAWLLEGLSRAGLSPE